MRRCKGDWSLISDHSWVDQQCDGIFLAHQYTKSPDGEAYVIRQMFLCSEQSVSFWGPANELSVEIVEVACRFRVSVLPFLRERGFPRAPSAALFLCKRLENGFHQRREPFVEFVPPLESVPRLGKDFLRVLQAEFLPNQSTCAEDLDSSKDPRKEWITILLEQGEIENVVGL